MTHIEWTDATWNPLAGCTRASAGCDHCYAATMARRLEFMAQADIDAGRDPGRKRKYIGTTNKNKGGHVHFNGTINLDLEALGEPFTWKRPRRVFVNSMSDLFHKDVPFGFVDRVFGVMAATPQHTYQVLTKRPERMAEYLNTQGRDTLVWIEAYSAALSPELKHNKPQWPLPNVWIGTSVEDQRAADERIPALLQAPAVVRFLSCEPLLGVVRLNPEWLFCPGREYGHGMNLTSAHAGGCCDRHPRIHWVIVGGESGPGARPMHPDWARSLRDQCARADVAFFFKQWGEYLPFDQCANAGVRMSTVDAMNYAFTGAPVRVGKKQAGRALDGREWNEMPEAQ